MLRQLVLGLALMIMVRAARADEPAWTKAADTKKPMTAAEAKAFIRRLTQYVLDHHLRRDESSAQRGLIYEYFWVEKRGTPQQWI